MPHLALLPFDVSIGDIGRYAKYIEFDDNIHLLINLEICVSTPVKSARNLYSKFFLESKDRVRTFEYRDQKDGVVYKC